MSTKYVLQERIGGVFVDTHIADTKEEIGYLKEVTSKGWRKGVFDAPRRTLERVDTEYSEGELEFLHLGGNPT